MKKERKFASAKQQTLTVFDGKEMRSFTDGKNGVVVAGYDEKLDQGYVLFDDDSSLMFKSPYITLFKELRELTKEEIEMHEAMLKEVTE